LPVKLTTTITHISSVPNSTNQTLLHEFHLYMKSIGTSDSYQNGNLKIMVYFAKFLGPDASFYEIYKRDQLIAFLDTRIKDAEIDPDKRWIRTWNDYLQRIKYFFRWLHNQKEREDKGSVSHYFTGLQQWGSSKPLPDIDNPLIEFQTVLVDKKLKVELEENKHYTKCYVKPSTRSSTSNNGDPKCDFSPTQEELDEFKSYSEKKLQNLHNLPF